MSVVELVHILCMVSMLIGARVLSVSVCVHAHVSMRVCTGLHSCAGMFVCVCVGLCVHTFVCVCVCLHVCVTVCMYMQCSNNYCLALNF